MISGIVTAMLMAAFLAIVFWAWSGRNRERFDRAAHLPLNDESARPARAPASCCSTEDRV